jgi:spore coat protein CotF
LKGEPILPQNKISDQTIAEDLLVSQKYMSGHYNIAVQESANPDLRRDFMSINQQVLDSAEKVFSCLEQKGWYQLKPADSKTINEARAKAQQQISM